MGAITSIAQPQLEKTSNCTSTSSFPIFNIFYKRNAQGGFTLSFNSTQVGAVIVYTYVYSMLAPPLKPKELGGSMSPEIVVANESQETNEVISVSHESTDSVALLIANDAPPPKPQV